jgi:hypothetical protein
MMLDYQEQLTPKLIWSIEQNKPTLIVKDLERYGVPAKVSHSILLARGVYKWLAVRRHIIKLKNTWRERITKTIGELVEAKKEHNNSYRIGYLRGYLKAYEEARAEVRELCHSERWQAPDFDSEAQVFLEAMDNGTPS